MRYFESFQMKRAEANISSREKRGRDSSPRESLCPGRLRLLILGGEKGEERRRGSEEAPTGGREKETAAFM